EKRHNKEIVGPETKVDYVFYPIVSRDNPDLKELTELEAKHGSWAKIPEEELPTPTHFTVLVKTHRFKKAGEIPPDAIRKEPSVQGLVVNEVSQLKTDEKILILQDF